MENEIKVWDWIRTNWGHIGKLKRIELDKNDKSLKWYVFDHKEFEINIIKEEYINKPYIVKHSSNLIDLIQCGDYVNGILVTGKESTLLWTEIKGIDRSGYHIPISQYGENIKTIVTKEMMESISYKVERNKKWNQKNINYLLENMILQKMIM